MNAFRYVDVVLWFPTTKLITAYQEYRFVHDSNCSPFGYHDFG